MNTLTEQRVTRVVPLALKVAEALRDAGLHIADTNGIACCPTLDTTALGVLWKQPKMHLKWYQKILPRSRRRVFLGRIWLDHKAIPEDQKGTHWYVEAFGQTESHVFESYLNDIGEKFGVEMILKVRYSERYLEAYDSDFEY